MNNELRARITNGQLREDASKKILKKISRVIQKHIGNDMDSSR